jgi:methylated-DNA-[protein]-cysteine S-methyltransferase
MILETSELSTPIGPLRLVTHDEVLHLVTFPHLWDAHRRRLLRYLPGAQLRPAAPRPAISAALSAYFDGDLQALDRLRVALHGTAFQCAVWSALRTIPAGSTASYAEQARRVGSPSAVRAVGAANGANPITLILPCHRVVGSGGALTGYAGGLETKRWLLVHEQRFAGLTLPFSEDSSGSSRSAPSLPS